MSALWQKTLETYHFLIVDYADHRTDNLPLMTSPWPILAICTVYAYFVMSLGPRIMKNRPPFNVQKAVNVYNILQIVICIYLIRRADICGADFTFPWINEPVDYSNSAYGLESVELTYKYFLLKILDFADTIFFILRKKNSQITFLHVYHHILMSLGTWLMTRYFPGGHFVFIGYINLYVHVIMYAYYFITSMWPQNTNQIWWKKYITIVQMIQFAAVAVHSTPLLFLSEPNFPKFGTSCVILLNISIFMLFFNFYKKAYLKNKVK